jgi:hypothetical protein
VNTVDGARRTSHFATVHRATLYRAGTGLPFLGFSSELPEPVFVFHARIDFDDVRSGAMRREQK